MNPITFFDNVKSQQLLTNLDYDHFSLDSFEGQKMNLEATPDIARHIYKPRAHHLPPLKDFIEKKSSITNAQTPPSPPLSSTKKRRKTEPNESFDKSLLDSIISGDLETFKSLSESVDMNRPLEREGKNSFSPLIWAITRKQFPIIKYLIEERNVRLDTHQEIEKGQIPVIVRALLGRSFSTAKYLFSKGAFVNAPFYYEGQKGPPLTFFANKPEYSDQMQFLIETLGANPNVRNSKNLSPLYLTLEKLSSETCNEKCTSLGNTAKLLEDYDADIEETDSFGNTLLMRLAENGCLFGVKYLACYHVADTQAKNQFGLDALSLVLNALNRPKITEVEVDRFESLFHFLAQTVTLEEAKLKLSSQIELKNDRACQLILEKFRIDIDEPIDSNENTFLIEYTKKGMTEHVHMLLNLGADPQKKNLHRESACSYACKKLNEFDERSRISWGPIFQSLSEETTKTMIKEADNEV
jgi:ankyrin repeat protein